MLPSKPMMSEKEREAVVERFINGAVSNTAPVASNQHSNQKSSTNIRNKEGIKMYNVPLPTEVHKRAKNCANNMGITLAQYVINAIAEANERNGGQ